MLNNIIKFRRITSTQIIHHTGSHVIGKYCSGDTIRCFQTKEDEINAKKSSCDAMYTKKYATVDVLLTKIRYPENMNTEQSRKVLAPLKTKQYKGIPRTKNDILIHYCQWKKR